MKLQEKKDVRLEIRISRSEYENLKFIADSLGWSVARLIRAYTEIFCGGLKK